MSIIKRPIDNAPEILKEAIRCIGDRAKERDMYQERSMKRCVTAFNAMTGLSLTEEEGWIFMVFLKLARSQQGEFKLDDYVDMLLTQLWLESLQCQIPKWSYQYEVHQQEQYPFVTSSLVSNR